MVGGPTWGLFIFLLVKQHTHIYCMYKFCRYGKSPLGLCMGLYIILYKAHNLGIFPSEKSPPSCLYDIAWGLTLTFSLVINTYCCLSSDGPSLLSCTRLHSSSKSPALLTWFSLASTSSLGSMAACPLLSWTYLEIM